MTAVTVPGANATFVTNNFNGLANTALAQSIATTLNGLLASGAFNVTSVAGGGTAPAATAGIVNELEIMTGGVVSVPAGYAFVADGSHNANLSIFGGNSFFGGAGNINYTNSGASPAVIVAGDGSDTFSLSGNYTVAAGSGSDTFSLSGTGQVSLGGGGNGVNITSGADTIFAGANPGPTGMLGGTGSVYFVAGASANTVADFIVGGSGGDTIFGAANNFVIYNSPTVGAASAPGALLVAGAGNETLFDVGATNDLLFAGNQGGNQLLAAGLGNDSLVTDSLIGGPGTDQFFISNSALVSAIAGTAVTPGVDFLYNTRAGETVNLTGFDTLYGAANSGAAANA
ncbi:MAG: hypothetical protein ABI224_07700, partial [Acetobacteraceae bacterium]